MLSNSANATIAQMVYIIHTRFGIHKLDKVLNNFNNIFLCQDTHARVCIQIQFVIDTITADFS